MKSFIIPACLLFFQTIAGAESASELPVVAQVDLNRYLEKWYEIATIPMRFQQGCTCVTAEYSLKGNGRIKVVNSCSRHTDCRGIF